MVVCSKEANRLPKQYCVSLCFFVLFVHLLSFLPVFVILCICLHHTCLTEHLSAWICLSLSALHGHFLDFHILLFSWRNRSKEGDLSSTHLSPSVTPAPETLRQRKSKYFPPALLFVCVCIYVSFFTPILLFSFIERIECVVYLATGPQAEVNLVFSILPCTYTSHFR